MNKTKSKRNNENKSKSPTNKGNNKDFVDHSSEEDSSDDEKNEINKKYPESESSDSDKGSDNKIQSKEEDSSDDEEKKAKKEEEALKKEIFASLPPHCKAFVPSEINPIKKPQTPTRETTPEECFVDCPRIISRAEWGAEKAKKEIKQVMCRVRPSIFMETDGPNCNAKKECVQILKTMQRLQMDLLNFNDIAFSFLISDDGTIYEGRGWGYVNEKAEGFAGIGYIGYYSLEPLEGPSEAMLKATYNLIMCGVRKGFLYNPFATGAFSGDTPIELVKSLMEHEEDVDYRTRPEDVGMD